MKKVAFSKSGVRRSHPGTGWVGGVAAPSRVPLEKPIMFVLPLPAAPGSRSLTTEWATAGHPKRDENQSRFG